MSARGLGGAAAEESAAALRPVHRRQGGRQQLRRRVHHRSAHAHPAAGASRAEPQGPGELPGLWLRLGPLLRGLLLHVTNVHFLDPTATRGGESLHWRVCWLFVRRLLHCERMLRSRGPACRPSGGGLRASRARPVAASSKSFISRVEGRLKAPLLCVCVCIIKTSAFQWLLPSRRVVSMSSVVSVEGGARCLCPADRVLLNGCSYQCLTFVLVLDY